MKTSVPTRLRRLVQNDNNCKTLIDIMKNGEITAEIVKRFSIDEMYNDGYFVSPFLYGPPHYRPC
jgi:hypothetical protein